MVRIAITKWIRHQTNVVREWTLAKEADPTLNVGFERNNTTTYRCTARIQAHIKKKGRDRSLRQGTKVDEQVLTTVVINSIIVIVNPDITSGIHRHAFNLFRNGAVERHQIHH